jgi:nitrogen fixation protein NifU and related proteins
MIDDLYQETILDHSRKPRNFGALDAANAQAEGFNPLCGDRVTVQLKLDGDVVSDAHFTGSGCAISVASASLMTEALKGKSRQEAEDIFGRFHRLLTAENGNSEDLGKLAVFSGVREYPARVKCATLAWHTLRAALDHARETVSTE